MLSFGVDLITFFHPGFWDLETESEVVELGKAQPRMFWDRMLDALEGTGVTGIELTFSPFGSDDLVAAYGSEDAAGAELARRGLAIASGFFPDIAIEGGIGDPEREARWIADGETLARRLKAWGASVMVIGLPMRASWNVQPPVFIDGAYGAKAADFANRLGAATLAHGVRLTLHTEAHSTFCQPRDIDLMLLMTDPVYVGFCPDAAHILLSGGEPNAIVERHAERVAIAHWKDARGPMPINIPIDEKVHEAHRPYFCALGDGKVDFDRWAQLMLARARAIEGAMEWAILEIDAVADPQREIERSLVVASKALETATQALGTSA